MQKKVIIVAGGSGSRMKSDLPKQFINLAGKPILMHSILAFVNFDSEIEIILVLPENQIETWNLLCEKHNFTIPHQIVTGGATRVESVRNGLNVLDHNGLIAIHDGVRPLVSSSTIARCFECAEKYNGAIPVMDVVDSLRITTEDGSQAVDRTKYKLVQTPQVFKAKVIQIAYKFAYGKEFTDDASVTDHCAILVKLVEGNRENIKITTPIDLLIAESIINERFKA